MRGISVEGGTLRLGALTRHAELLTAPEIAAHAPLLARAAAHIAHPAIRSRGTLGGSLANADPAAELPACMLALNARIIVESAARRAPYAARRRLLHRPVRDGSGAGRVAGRGRDRSAGPRRPASGFAELARRSGDYAIIGLAAQGELAGGRFSALRLGYFSAGPVPVLARGAAAALVERDAGGRRAGAGGAIWSPHDDLQASAATRLHLARVLLRRVIGRDAGMTAPVPINLMVNGEAIVRQRACRGPISPTSCAMSSG